MFKGIILGSLLGAVFFTTLAEAGEATLKKQNAKINLAKKRNCPQNLDGDIVEQFAEGYPENASDPHNVLVKDDIRIRSALSHDITIRRKIQAEQVQKGGNWSLTNEAPLSGAHSSVCTYTNGRLDRDINTIKVSVYPK
ncbi:MAG: hypothetical protein FJX71_01460 [Alphaproteobacteria bacterium]|nr:hypothetical protein [Alphaproteobacteria bacterium]